jgi:hypothetical protein
MARQARPAGFTILEVVAAMGVLLIGAVGLASLHTMGARMNADGRVVGRATVIATDLVTHMQKWSFVDPRLQNTHTANDAQFNDPNGDFENDSTAITSDLYDHEESELEAQAAPYVWVGIPSAEVQAQGFKRYWNVAEVDYDENGFLSAKRIAVIVRWEKNGVGRRIVLVTALGNPSSTN